MKWHVFTAFGTVAAADQLNEIESAGGKVFAVDEEFSRGDNAPVFFIVARLPKELVEEE